MIWIYLGARFILYMYLLCTITYIIIIIITVAVIIIVIIPVTIAVIVTITVANTITVTGIVTINITITITVAINITVTIVCTLSSVNLKHAGLKPEGFEALLICLDFSYSFFYYRLLLLAWGMYSCKLLESKVWAAMPVCQFLIDYHCYLLIGLMGYLVELSKFCCFYRSFLLKDLSICLTLSSIYQIPPIHWAARSYKRLKKIHMW